MALNFFKQRDIDEMDVNDIPEEFINYFDTLDVSGKTALVGSRPDLAKALGFVLPSEKEEPRNDAGDSLPKSGNDGIEVKNPVSDQTEEKASERIETDNNSSKDVLSEIKKNRYAKLNLDAELEKGLGYVELLTLPNNHNGKCSVHRSNLISKSVKYTRKINDHVTRSFTLKLFVCYKCKRLYILEKDVANVHAKIDEYKISHQIYSVDETSRYLISQQPTHIFSDDEKLYVPEVWIENRPKCPIHDTELYIMPCARINKTHKERKVEFKGHYCSKCAKVLVRHAVALDLEDECAAKGVPVIEFETLVKTKPKKQAFKAKDIKPHYFVQDGKRNAYKYDHVADCFNLTEEDTVVVSDSIYCTLDGHETNEVLAQIWVNEKTGARKSYLVMVGYCDQCEKYYMDVDDYKVIYHVGRPEVVILHDLEDQDYLITSGEVFNLERNHLNALESSINSEERSIMSSPDYVSPYATGDYDDGGLSFQKDASKRKYGKRLEELNDYKPRPYSYRVDITDANKTEVYYVGAVDVIVDGKMQVISANSPLGYELVNYQTVKVHKDGREYDIKLSRQFDIGNARLYGYTNLRTDEDAVFKSGITDPFLVRVLNMRKKQHNLTDIFVTIQENQNKIVNAAFTGNMVIQGCAGSGKTMVLLHRLSSLSYKNRGFDFSRQAMILTPNDQFNLHIGSVIESLQIGYIKRASVEQYYIEMLLQYDPAFKPENKIVSEMNVRQVFVDYVYSDQFKTDLAKAYKEVISERNALTEILDNLADAIGRPQREYDLTDDTRVLTQMKNAVDSYKYHVMQQDEKSNSAKKDLERLQERKTFLEQRIPETEKFANSIVQECLGRVYSKIGAYLSEKQHNIEGMEEQLKALTDERERVQGRIIMFGKRAALEKLAEDISDIEKKISSAKRQMEAETEILSESQQEKSDEAIITWMRLISTYIKDIQDEVRLYNTTKEEYVRLSEEMSSIDEKVTDAEEKYRLALDEQYSDEVKKAVEYLLGRIEEYSLLNLYQQVFDRAVSEFKKANRVGSISGKYHRYDLYARLLFAKLYYKKVFGTVNFMCVDEGQDLAINEYRLIKELNANNIVFNIFGDTNQLMKPGRGIADWKQLEEVVSFQIFVLNENYRNTNQITKFCNSSFDMNVLQTGVDGAKVREIPRRDLEKELASVNPDTERVAILLPRATQKGRYIQKDILPKHIADVIGDDIKAGSIAYMYVDEVKGIEFDKYMWLITEWQEMKNTLHIQEHCQS